MRDTHKKLKRKIVKSLGIFLLKELLGVMPSLNKAVSYTVCHPLQLSYKKKKKLPDANDDDISFKRNI